MILFPKDFSLPGKLIKPSTKLVTAFNVNSLIFAGNSLKAEIVVVTLFFKAVAKLDKDFLTEVNAVTSLFFKADSKFSIF